MRVRGNEKTGIPYTLKEMMIESLEEVFTTRLIGWAKDELADFNSKEFTAGREQTLKEIEITESVQAKLRNAEKAQIELFEEAAKIWPGDLFQDVANEQDVWKEIYSSISSSCAERLAQLKISLVRWESCVELGNFIITIMEYDKKIKGLIEAAKTTEESKQKPIAREAIRTLTKISTLNVAAALYMRKCAECKYKGQKELSESTEAMRHEIDQTVLYALHVKKALKEHLEIL